MTIRFHAGGLLPPAAPLRGGTTSGQAPYLFPTLMNAYRNLVFHQDFARIGDSDMPRTPVPVHERVDLRDGVVTWPIRDQGTSMMCVAYAVGACIELQQALHEELGTQPVLLSAGYLYWAMRKHPPPGGIEGWEKGGTRCDCAIPALADQGICKLSECPDELGMNDPPQDAMLAPIRLTGLRDAVSQVPGQPAIGQDAGIVTNELAMVVLAELDANYPVCMGFPVFRTANGSTNWNDGGETDGTIEFPANIGPDEHLGGHAVCVVGYEPDADIGRTDGGYFIFRNSSGPDFGTRHAKRGITGSGYGRISVKNAQDNCWDFLSLRPRDS